MLDETEPKPKKEYSTRKKQIDFAKIGEKLSLTGSNCHYCKSIMTVQDSNACRNNEKGSVKKKSCNKKFCYDCLQKNFPLFWEGRANKDWKCPCCSNECVCSQCKKNWIKQKAKDDEISDNINKDNITNSCEKSINANMHNYKLKGIEKMPYIIPKPKIDIITDTSFLNFKHARDDYLVTLEKYKEHLGELNILKITN